MAEIHELTRQVSDLSGDHMALRAAFESHREHCSTDKADMKDELKSINGKLWALLVAGLLQAIVVIGYFATEGTPWVTQAVAETRK
jgi:hypothetical protein